MSLGLLQQRLPDAGDVAVAEDAEAAGDQPLLVAVALGVLGGQEADEGLGDGQSHACLLPELIGSRGIHVLAVPGSRGSRRAPGRR